MLRTKRNQQGARAQEDGEVNAARGISLREGEGSQAAEEPPARAVIKRTSDTVDMKADRIELLEQATTAAAREVIGTRAPMSTQGAVVGAKVRGYCRQKVRAASTADRGAGPEQ